jgi:hypothetical protein
VISRRPRRKLRTYLLYAFLTVILTAVGLTLRSAHRIRQAEAAVAELRRPGATVSDRYETDEFWRTFVRAVGLSPNNGLFERAVYTVKIDGSRLGSDEQCAAALRAAARLPDLVDLQISNIVDLDDALAPIGDCTDLRQLGFYKTGVTDEGLRHLQNCRQLRFVQVGECPVTDEGIRVLCSLPSMRGVSVISCLSQTTLDDLSFASPDAPMPQPGRPLTITGQLRLASPFPVATATLRFFITNADAPHQALQSSTVVTLDAANQAAFSVTVKNGGAELQPGRNVLYVMVMLPSMPAIQYHFERIIPPVAGPE